MDSVPFSLLLVVLGLAPSLIWLWFFVRRDPHPEPRSLIARTFLMGIIVSPIAIILQQIFKTHVDQSIQSSSFIFWAALVEEFIKFAAVYIVVIRNPEFDEPVDAMIYMITAALGFAAMENILVAFSAVSSGVNVVFGTLALRFIGATVLHALSSGIVGYFLGMSWFFLHHKTKLILLGLGIATLFHATFNILIATNSNQVSSLILTTVLLVAMAFLLSVLFDKMKDRDTGTLEQLTLA